MKELLILGGRVHAVGGGGHRRRGHRDRAVSTVFLFARSLLAPYEYSTSDIRLHLGRFLVLGLEFQLAADVLATAIAPPWEAVRLLASIVVIRTVLNYFLSKELEREQAQPRLGRTDPGA